MFSTYRVARGCRRRCRSASSRTRRAPRGSDSIFRPRRRCSRLEDFIDRRKKSKVEISLSGLLLTAYVFFFFFLILSKVFDMRTGNRVRAGNHSPDEVDCPERDRGPRRYCCSDSASRQAAALRSSTPRPSSSLDRDASRICSSPSTSH